MNPLISIIVPIYNTEKYLEECIRSIIHQKYTNLEIILVNDGSTDSSLSICEKYQKIDERIKVISIENSGVSVARNMGLEASYGEYIGFVDSDDSIEDDMYEQLIYHIQKNHSDVAYLTLGSIKKPNKNLTKLIYKEEAIKNLLLLTFPSSLCSNLYHKKVIKKEKLDTSIHFFEDLEFNYRVLNNCTRSIVAVEGNLYRYRKHENNSNHSSLNYKRMTSLNIEEKLNVKSLKVKKYAINSYIHFLLSVVLSISKSKKNEVFLKESHAYSKKIIKKYPILFSSTNSIYKFFLLSYIVCPIFTIKCLQMFRYMRKLK